MQLRLIPSLALIALVLSFALPQASADSAAPAGKAIQVQGGALMFAGRVYHSAHLSAHPHLIVVLHGDAPGINPTYQYKFARDAADALDDAVVVALLRPGYADGEGLQSQGRIGWKLGDNYTRDRIDAIAAAVQAVAARYHAADLTMAGHSGGSAIAADLLGLHPHLASRALLVSCPCDVPAFRWSMMKFQWNPLWLLPQSSVSPQDEVPTIPDDTLVSMVVGAADPVAPSALTLAFAGALRAKGGHVTVTILPGLGHEIFLKPQVLHQLQDLIDTPLPSAGSN